MIDNIDANQMQDISGKSPFKQPDAGKAARSGGEDVSLQVRYASLINKATQMPQTNSKAVKEARELVLSGEIENPAYARAAAQNILARGV
jgi:hypothetical protein